jgi:hypothetical protein
LQALVLSTFGAVSGMVSDLRGRVQPWERS